MAVCVTAEARVPDDQPTRTAHSLKVDQRPPLRLIDIESTSVALISRPLRHRRAQEGKGLELLAPLSHRPVAGNVLLRVDRAVPELHVTPHSRILFVELLDAAPLDAVLVDRRIRQDVANADGHRRHLR